MLENRRLAIWSSAESLIEKLKLLPAGHYLEWSINGHAITILDENGEYVGYINFSDGESRLYLASIDWDEVE